MRVQPRPAHRAGRAVRFASFLAGAEAVRAVVQAGLRPANCRLIDALALKDFPNLNALWTSEGIELHQQVDLAMAVALEEGLITPVIRDAANKTLSAISAASKDLAKRAREGALKPEEYQGGTVTISNMGMFGVESFAAIINPPQAAIVAVSSIMQRAMFKDDEVAPVSIMKLTLSADHRISNGAEGAQYLAEVKRLLERPMTLVV